MVTKTKPVMEEATNGKEHSPMLDGARKVLMASIGAVALAQDEIEDFVNKLVDRGEIAEKDGKKLVREIMDRRQKKTKETEDQIGKRVEEVLDRMNVPTKADIEALGDKIATLTKKVDELKKVQV
jgi:poly(hydroxyalkanoate) granule-associated protein